MIKFYNLIFILINLIIMFASCVYCLKKYKSLYAPVNIYIFMNSLTLAFANIRLIPIYTPNIQVNLLAIISMFLFWIGDILASCNKKIVINRKSYININNKFVVNKLFYSSFIVSFLGNSYQLSNMLEKYSLKTILENPWILQGNFQVQFVGYATLIGILVLPLFIMKKKLNLVKLIDIILVIITLIGLFMTGMKTYMIMSMVIGFICLTNIQKSINLKYIFLIISIAITFFIFYDSYVDVFTTVDIKDSFISPRLQKPVLYMTGPWAAFNNITTSQIEGPIVIGAITFQIFWKIMNYIGIIGPISRIMEFSYIGLSDFNTYGFIGEIFWDTGIIGLCVTSLAISFIISKIYIRAIQGNKVEDIIISAVLMYCLFISFFLYFFNFNILILILFIFIFSRKMKISFK